MTVFTVDSEIQNAPRELLLGLMRRISGFQMEKVPSRAGIMMSMTSSEKMDYPRRCWVEGETEGTEWIPESTGKVYYL